MTAGDQLRTLRVRRQLLEARRERLVVNDFVFSSPDQQCRELRLLELTFEPLKPLETTCGVIKRNPARPGPGEEARSRIWQDALIDALRLVAEFFSIDDRQIHSATSQRIVPAKKVWTDKGRVHHAPRKYPRVEFRRPKWPAPPAHDHESTDAVGIGWCRTKTGRAAPITADNGRVPNVELP